MIRNSRSLLFSYMKLCLRAPANQCGIVFIYIIIAISYRVMETLPKIELQGIYSISFHLECITNYEINAKVKRWSKFFSFSLFFLIIKPMCNRVLVFQVWFCNTINYLFGFKLDLNWKIDVYTHSLTHTHTPIYIYLYVFQDSIPISLLINKATVYVRYECTRRSQNLQTTIFSALVFKAKG